MTESSEQRYNRLARHPRGAVPVEQTVGEGERDPKSLWALAEALLIEEDEQRLLAKLLEQMVVLQGLRYGGLFEREGHAFAARSEYSANGGESPLRARLVSASGAADEIRDGNPAPGAGEWDIRPHDLQFADSGFTPAGLVAIAFPQHGRAPAILVFADAQRSGAELESISPVLQTMASIARIRLDQLEAQRQLTATNRELEQRVAEQKAQLESASRSLEAADAERQRTKIVLRQAAAAFENVSEGVAITDSAQLIIAVNHVFTEVTGYTADEVIGKTPRILQSGRHDAAFYAAMWQSIHDTGHWHGEIWNRRKDGVVYPEILTITAVKNAEGETTHYMALFSDITAVKESEARFAHLADYDPLTDLPNRRLFRMKLDHAADEARRRESRLAIAIVGIDGFKALNESLGLAVGDELLRHLARLLRECARESDTVARLAGDEFIVLMSDPSDVRGVAWVVRRMLDALARPIEIEGRQLFITCSAGVSLYPDDAEELPALLRNAHVAFRRAKQSGRKQYRLYSPDMRAPADEQFLIESDLRRADVSREFVLHFQPQFSISTGRIVGVEALVRWQHPDRGLLPPASFIRIAEETGVIESLGAWVLKEACTQAVAWQSEGFAPLHVAVNLSARQIRASLSDTVSMALLESGLEPHLLELEITEGFLMEQPDEALTTLKFLKDIGVTLAIDDFGTGYSSMSYLKLFPVDKLKIDRSFVGDVMSNANDDAIARAILTLGHGLDLKVTAEGVETEAQLDYFKQHLCDEVQGFLLGRPVPAPQVRQFLH